MDAEIKSQRVNGPTGYTATFTIYCHLYILEGQVSQVEHTSAFVYIEPNQNGSKTNQTKGE